MHVLSRGHLGLAWLMRLELLPDTRVESLLVHHGGRRLIRRDRTQLVQVIEVDAFIEGDSRVRLVEEGQVKLLRRHFWNDLRDS
jgi:hypothetical protein